MKKLLLSIFALVPLVNYGQFTESFENTMPPPNWNIVIDNASYSGWHTLDFSLEPLQQTVDGNKAAVSPFSYDPHNDFLITPAITVTSGVSDYISFYAKRYFDPLAVSTIALKLSNSTRETAAFTTLISDITPGNSTEFQKYSFDLTAYIGQTVYLAFVSTAIDQHGVLIDDVTVSGIPTCAEPTNATAAVSSESGFSLSWTPPATGPVSSYEYYYSTTNTKPAANVTGITVSAATTSINSSLDPGKTYYMWVRSNCGNVVSAWSNRAILVLPSAIPYAYSFETGFALSTGWSTATISGNDFHSNEENEAVNPEYVPQDGKRYVTIYGGDRFTTTDAWLYSRALYLTAGTPVDISYYLKKFNSVGTASVNNLAVTLGNDKTAAAQNLIVAEHNNYTTTTYTKQTATFTPTATGIYYLGFHATAPKSNTNDYGGLFLDNFQISPATSCQEPVSVTVGEITSTIPVLSWTAPAAAPENGYEYYVSTLNTEPAIGATPTGAVAAGVTQVAVTALNPATTYYAWVRSKCDVGTSAWSNRATLIIPGLIPYAYGFESGIGLDTGWTTVSSSGYKFEASSYNASGYMAQEGERFVISPAHPLDTNDFWLYSRALYLNAGIPLTMGYYLKKIDGTTGVNNITATIGTEKTATAQSTILNVHTNYILPDYTLQTATFTPQTTGIYYLGFHDTSPANDAVDRGYLLLDNITVSQNLSTKQEQALVSQITIYPNPAADFVNLKSEEHIILKTVVITDLNGRIVKTVAFDRQVTEAQVGISDLSTGMYLIKTVTDKGTVTRKIVKQ